MLKRPMGSKLASMNMSCQDPNAKREVVHSEASKIIPSMLGNFPDLSETFFHGHRSNTAIINH